MVDILEAYRSFDPPKWFRPTVDRLLASLASEHTSNLRAIVLTDSHSIGKGKTQRVAGRKFRRSECLGFYNPAYRGEQPWIQLVVDNIIKSKSPSFLRLQLFRDLVVSKTLFHELGHHLHETLGSASRGGESAAHDWTRRLSRIHFRAKYWYLRPVVLALRPMLRFARNMARRKAAA